MNILSLGDANLERAFAMADFKDHKSLALTCRRFNSVEHQDVLWKSHLESRGLVAEEGAARKTFISHLRRFCSHLSETCYRDTYDVNNIFYLYKKVMGSLTNERITEVFSLLLGTPKEKEGKLHFTVGKVPRLTSPQKYFLNICLCQEAGGIVQFNEANTLRIDHMITYKFPIQLYKMEFLNNPATTVSVNLVKYAMLEQIPEEILSLLLSKIPAEDRKKDLLDCYLRSEKISVKIVKQLLELFDVRSIHIGLAFSQRLPNDLIESMLLKAEKSMHFDSDGLESIHYCARDGHSYPDELFIRYISLVKKISTKWLLLDRTSPLKPFPSEAILRAVSQKIQVTADQLLTMIEHQCSIEFLHYMLQQAAKDEHLDTKECIPQLFSAHFAKDKDPKGLDGLILAFAKHASSIDAKFVHACIVSEFSHETIGELLKKVTKTDYATFLAATNPSYLHSPHPHNVRTSIPDEILITILHKSAGYEPHWFDAAIGKVSENVLRALLQVEQQKQSSLHAKQRIDRLLTILEYGYSEEFVVEFAEKCAEIPRKVYDFACKKQVSTTVLAALKAKQPSFCTIM